jgi:hypothetical protein
MIHDHGVRCWSNHPILEKILEKETSRGEITHLDSTLAARGMYAAALSFWTEELSWVLRCL